MKLVVRLYKHMLINCLLQQLTGSWHLTSCMDVWQDSTELGQQALADYDELLKRFSISLFLFLLMIFSLPVGEAVRCSSARPTGRERGGNQE